MSDPLAQIREQVKRTPAPRGSYPGERKPTTGQVVSGGIVSPETLARLRSASPPRDTPLTEALKSAEGRLLTAIATVNGHGHPLQYATDVLSALKKLTPA